MLFGSAPLQLTITVIPTSLFRTEGSVSQVLMQKLLTPSMAGPHIVLVMAKEELGSTRFTV